MPSVLAIEEIERHKNLDRQMLDWDYFWDEYSEDSQSTFVSDVDDRDVYPDQATLTTILDHFGHAHTSYDASSTPDDQLEVDPLKTKTTEFDEDGNGVVWDASLGSWVQIGVALEADDDEANVTWDPSLGSWVQIDIDPPERKNELFDIKKPFGLAHSVSLTHRPRFYKPNSNPTDSSSDSSSDSSPDLLSPNSSLDSSPDSDSRSETSRELDEIACLSEWRTDEAGLMTKYFKHQFDAHHDELNLTQKRLKNQGKMIGIVPSHGRPEFNVSSPSFGSSFFSANSPLRSLKSPSRTPSPGFITILNPRKKNPEESKADCRWWLKTKNKSRSEIARDRSERENNNTSIFYPREAERRNSEEIKKEQEEREEQWKKEQKSRERASRTERLLTKKEIQKGREARYKRNFYLKELKAKRKLYRAAKKRFTMWAEIAKTHQPTTDSVTDDSSFRSDDTDADRNTESDIGARAASPASSSIVTTSWSSESSDHPVGFWRITPKGWSEPLSTDSESEKSETDITSVTNSDSTETTDDTESDDNESNDNESDNNSDDDLPDLVETEYDSDESGAEMGSDPGGVEENHDFEHSYVLSFAPLGTWGDSVRALLDIRCAFAQFTRAQRRSSEGFVSDESDSDSDSDSGPSEPPSSPSENSDDWFSGLSHLDPDEFFTEPWNFPFGHLYSSDFEPRMSSPGGM